MKWLFYKISAKWSYLKMIYLKVRQIGQHHYHLSCHSIKVKQAASVINKAKYATFTKFTWEQSSWSICWNGQKVYSGCSRVPADYVPLAVADPAGDELATTALFVTKLHVVFGKMRLTSIPIFQLRYGNKPL